jgi:hypothetical protein
MRPGIELMQFKASDLRMRQVEGLAVTIQEIEGLKEIAAVLKRSGLGLQVDDTNRTFGMHQLLQRAVGFEMGYEMPCQHMKELLLARFGCFGDEEVFDLKAHKLIREMLDAAIACTERMKIEGSERWWKWCSGMLLRLYETALEVHGKDFAEIRYSHLISNAYGSISAHLNYACVMKKSVRSEERKKKLRFIVHDFTHSIALEASKIDTRSISAELGSDSYHVYHDWMKFLFNHWGLKGHRSLVAQLVHMHVLQEGDLLPLGRMMQIEVLMAVPLINDLISMCEHFDLENCLNVSAKSSCMNVENGSVFAYDEAHSDCNLYSADDDLSEIQSLWNLLCFGQNTSLLDSIVQKHIRNLAFKGKWELDIALGNVACASGKLHFRQGNYDSAIASFKAASELRLDSLGQEHPATANAILLMALSSISQRQVFVPWPFPCDSFLSWCNRLLRIFEDTLGEHPFMARAMWQMCEAAQKFRLHDHFLELHERALHIFESVMGREHCDVADALMSICVEYQHRGDLIKAEELAGEAYKIFHTLLGDLHMKTSRACVCLFDIQKSMGKKPDDVHGMAQISRSHIFDHDFDIGITYENGSPFGIPIGDLLQAFHNFYG